jgi:hypothetical protein
VARARADVSRALESRDDATTATLRAELLDAERALREERKISGAESQGARLLREEVKRVEAELARQREETVWRVAEAELRASNAEAELRASRADRHPEDASRSPRASPASSEDITAAFSEASIPESVVHAMLEEKETEIGTLKVSEASKDAEIERLRRRVEEMERPSAPTSPTASSPRMRSSMALAMAMSMSRSTPASVSTSPSSSPPVRRTSMTMSPSPPTPTTGTGTGSPKSPTKTMGVLSWRRRGRGITTRTGGELR